MIAEVIRSARRQNFTGYGGACQSDASNAPYLPWKTVWSAFYGVDTEMPPRRQVRLLEGEIEDRAPDRIAALPLLSPMLDLAIPENDFTRALEPQYRRSALHALLLDSLKAARNGRRATRFSWRNCSTTCATGDSTRLTRRILPKSNWPIRCMP